MSIWNKVLLVLIALLAIGSIILAGKIYATKSKHEKDKQTAEVKIVQEDEKIEKIIEEPDGVREYSIKLDAAYNDRQRAWFGCEATGFTSATNVIKVHIDGLKEVDTEDTELPRDLYFSEIFPENDTVVFVFDEKPVDEGGAYLGRFIVKNCSVNSSRGDDIEKVSDATFDLYPIDPIFTKNDKDVLSLEGTTLETDTERLEAFQSRKSTLAIYESMPNYILDFTTEEIAKINRILSGSDPSGGDSVEDDDSVDIQLDEFTQLFLAYDGNDQDILSEERSFSQRLELIESEYPELAEKILLAKLELQDYAFFFSDIMTERTRDLGYIRDLIEKLEMLKKDELIANDDKKALEDERDLLVKEIDALINQAESIWADKVTKNADRTLSVEPGGLLARMIALREQLKEDIEKQRSDNENKFKELQRVQQESREIIENRHSQVFPMAL